AAGDVLGTLASAQLVANRLDAVAALQAAQADKDELLAGPRSEARTITDTTVTNAERYVEQVTAEYDEKVENARRVLLTTNLEAVSLNPGESATAPLITGTYSCETEGQYTIAVYRSGAVSGASYRLSGIETDSDSVYTSGPAALGSCGLFIQFSESEQYGNSEWEITIPNKKSSTYQSNLNTYNLTLQQRANAIAAAEDALALAKEEATLTNAAPRGEDLVRSNASILQAQARISAIDAQISDRSIVSPYDGIVTDVQIQPGETASTIAVITLLSSEAFQLTARIPEIDITKIAEGQQTNVVFDAKSLETLPGEVAFISPLATMIDGVAYFEATIAFNEVPIWMRSGLNADIDIIARAVTDAVRVPSRFVTTTPEGSTLLVLTDPDSQETRSIDAQVVFTGNDGYTAVKSITPGTVIVAP
ncbi:efflux RND transporter periplasmic adaptor subunit, partial [Candidatus Pacebacteria bacterium]|nr:efflux RND transporter periplasmic adaptor subunit [Candidatus Paceibacterota bacterium]